MPAYIIFTRTKTIDRGELEKYWSMIKKTMNGHAIEVLVSYGNFDVLEGEDIEGIVVAKFPDMASAKNWYYSDSYKAAAAHRIKGAIYNGVLVEGIF
ncbi:hypothetical protein CEY12_20625 [Chryseobacterium sp. T16E-39]|uniref:DUF1330 domain-containing protein n=1 Tax=Chryseobacterium sp. T16E-39 TaxID=2015076 RepID=UPI000B5B41A4|nr:DUF1330 domain-containing protein [Chryseobacterium sp. T16E-39]ASK32339.1 hypothetical protein CEY12_20625 [Chryseobacterium sp. T16E-39]